MAENKQQQEIKDITDKLEQGIQELFESDRFREFLSCMAKFHRYSLNNQLLIAMQKPDATLIAGYNAWEQQHKRHVMKGERGIRILAPIKKKIPMEVEDIDPDTKQPRRDPEGNVIMKKSVEERMFYKAVSVFDVSQTDGEPIPTLGVDELTGDVEEYEHFFDALKRTSPVPIEFEKIESGAKGYYHQEERRIAINEGMSQVQNVKTAIHEMAHQKLHAKENLQPGEKPSTNTKEVEAESIAYTICQHYGIDTSDYSFSYVAGWSVGKDTPELKASLNRIRVAASELINEIDEHIEKINLELEEEAKLNITFDLKVTEPAGFSIAKVHGTADVIEPALLVLQKANMDSPVEDPEAFLRNQGVIVDHVCDNNSEGYAKYSVTTYEFDKESSNLTRCGSVLGLAGEAVIGETHYASGEEFHFTNGEEYLKEIREEIEYSNTSGFTYHTLSLDPELRKAVDDIVCNLYGEKNEKPLEKYEVSSERIVDQAREARAKEIANFIVQAAEGIDPYEFKDSVDDSGVIGLDIKNALLTGSKEVGEIRAWFAEVMDDHVEAELVVGMIDAFTDGAFVPDEKVSKAVEDKELGSISFYVAECMEFPSMGELHEGLTLQEAFELYEQIPDSRMNGIKGIGFDLQDGSFFDGQFELMSGGVLNDDMINYITHYRNSELVQQAVADCKAEMLNRGMSIEDSVEQGAFQVGEDKYLSMQRASDDSWDYTLYNKDGSEIDGGQIGDSTMTFAEARNEILQSFDLMEEKLTSMNPETLENKVQFAEAKKLYEEGYVVEDYVLRSAASVRVEDVMDMCSLSEDSFNEEQLAVIREAANLDLSLTDLMHPEFSAEQLVFALELMKEGQDAQAIYVGGKHVSVVAEPMSSEDISSMKRQIAYDSIPKLLYSPEQWKEIETGMKHKLDVSVFAKPEFTPEQMKELRIGLDKGISVEAYCDSAFDYRQMKEIRRGLEAGIDVSSYAKPEIAATDMRKSFFTLKDGENALQNEAEKAQPDKDTGLYRYYSTQRPVAPGTYPGKPEHIENFDIREKIENGSMEAWGYVDYSRPLTIKEVSDFELKPAHIEAVADKQSSISLPKKVEKEKKPSLLANLREKQQQIAKESKPKAKAKNKEVRE